MKKYLFIIPVLFFASCALDSENNNISNTSQIEIWSSQTIENIDSRWIEDFWSGFTLSTSRNESKLTYNEKIIKEWSDLVKIRIVPFDSRFYKIYRDTDNDFQIWLYDIKSGNIHEFWNGKAGDIITGIRFDDIWINIDTKYSSWKIHLNENPDNFPLEKVIGMYLTFSPDFSKLQSWQYMEYYRKISLEDDKKIVIKYFNDSWKNNLILENFQLKWVYYKNAVYIGWINTWCFQDWEETICMVPKFFVVIDNDGKVVYYDETNWDFECKNMEQSLTGKVLESVWEKFCPNLQKQVLDQ